jgi:hypothetical protein
VAALTDQKIDFRKNLASDTLEPYMPDLRPGNRGIGVSVAVEHSLPYGDCMIREVIRTLQVWDADACIVGTLERGVVISSCSIQRSLPGSDAEAYQVQFLSSGRRYCCPLYLFQPRTRIVQATPLAPR